MYQPSEEFSFDPAYPEGLTQVETSCLTGTHQSAIRVYDFFSGCGGTSVGLRKAGLAPTVALDMDEEALETFRLNFPEAHVIKSDIRTVSTTDLEPYLERQRTVPILFSACAPCQPFSKQNRQKKEADARISLLTELIRFLERFRPELLFVENVPGLQEFSEDEDGPLHDLVTVLDRLGYWHSARVILAQDYGIPQNRRRLVLVASAFGPINLPERTHGPDRAPYRTVRDAIGHLPPLEAGESDISVPNHYACKLSPLNLERIRAVGEGGGRLTWDQRLHLDCHRTVKGFSDVYGRMSWDKPSPALTTRCISLSNGRFGHPEQDRAISIREAACIQTFPKDFIFLGTVNGMARQIGNAVPPDLAASIGKALVEHVDKYWSKTDG